MLSFVDFTVDVDSLVDSLSLDCLAGTVLTAKKY